MHNTLSFYQYRKDKSSQIAHTGHYSSLPLLINQRCDIDEQRVCVPVCRWNQLDLVIVLLSIMGITLEKIEEASLPINPTIIRIMRVLRIARGTNAAHFVTANVAGHSSGWSPPDGTGRRTADMRE